ncbi:hypothetical protein HY642_01910 [Candidatus Woesearchaeota archaeon]|nr:hypothetical protein [Candidatus Woesearchaeota archaeon]
MKQAFVAVMMIMIIAILPSAFAHMGESPEVEALAERAAEGIDCSALSEKQLADLGEELMVRMMGAERHELMDKAMGEQEPSMHRMLAVSMACKTANEPSFMGMRGGSYSGMGGMMGNGMMGGMHGGMMRMMGVNWSGGMMGGFGFGVYAVLGWLLAIGLVVLVWLWVWKLWKDVHKR